MKISPKIKISSLFHFSGVVLYRFFLDLCYVTIIHPYFNYAGFFKEPTTQSTVVSWIALLVFVPVIISLYRIEKISANILALLFLVFFVPVTSLMRFIPMKTGFFLAFMLYWMFFVIFYKNIPAFVFSKQKPKRSRFLLWLILVLLIISVLYVSGHFFGFRLHFNLMTVYSLRIEERHLSLPIMLKYLLPAAANLLPVFFVYFLYMKKKIIALIIGFVILLDFAIGGHKTIIFMLVISVLGYWFYSKESIKMASWGFVVIILISLIEPLVLKTYFIGNIFIRRVFFVPARLNYYYYDFFSHHDYDFLRQGILRWFGFSSSYKLGIPFIIGEKYFGHPSMRANNGLFSDAYSNLGLLGSVVFPFILTILLKLFDSCTKGLDSKLLIVPIVVALAFGSGTFSVVLLSHGIILLWITLSLIPRYSKI